MHVSHVYSSMSVLSIVLLHCPQRVEAGGTVSDWIFSAPTAGRIRLLLQGLGFRGLSSSPCSMALHHEVPSHTTLVYICRKPSYHYPLWS